LSSPRLDGWRPVDRDFDRDDRDPAPAYALNTGVMTQRQPPTALLDELTLAQSAVVANCAMNRERQLAGVNSYTRELGFNPLDVVMARIESGSGTGPGAAAWLDLCCGSGRPLTQAARQLPQAGLSGRATLVGIDLVDTFESSAEPPPGLKLVCSPAAAWQPALRFDLITCVHGLHYIGDKPTLLTRAASWLAPAGRLVADLDLAAIRVDGQVASRRLARELREAGFSYDTRRHQITCTGYREVRFPYTYLGADDRLGTGYTGQPAVWSHYTAG
jgi:SAM-dependent methyltransferase